MKICTEQDCDRRAHAKGLCNMHYQRKRRSEQPETYKAQARARRDAQGIPARRDALAIEFRDELGRKRCANCEEWKPESEFYPKGSASDGFNAHCSECFLERQTRNRPLGPGASWSTRRKSHKRQELMEEQGGLCKLCDRDITSAFTAIDHDHACHPLGSYCDNCVRGLLCNRCNTALGGFMDDVGNLYKAIEYLEDYQRSRMMARAS